MKDAFYFPHYCNARHDRKLKRVRKELGLEGYGIFFMLLEVLREQADYKFPMQDIDLLADEFGTSEQKVRTVICNYDLFKMDENEKFFSANLILYLQPYIQTKERKRIAGIRGNLIRYKYITKEQNEKFSDDQILEINDGLALRPHSDGLGIAINKERKKEIKEIKEIKKETKTSETDSDPFKAAKDLVNILAKQKTIEPEEF